MNFCITLNGVPRCPGGIMRSLHDTGTPGLEVYAGLILLFAACIGFFVFRDPN